MKKNLWIWALAALSMAACSSEETSAPQVTDNDWISPDGRVVVQLGAESTATVGVSRAPITGTNITVLKDLGIFALNRTAQFTDAILEQDEWLNSTDCLLMNVKAQGADAGNNNPIDALDPTVNTGKKISLYKADESQAGAVYYYPMQGNQNYDFYGYQPRTDSEVSVVGGKMQVSMTLDGDKDLITGINNPDGGDYKGYAPQVSEADLYDKEATFDGNTITNAPESTLSGMLDGYNAKYIRKIKYHNWIVDECTGKDNADEFELEEKKPFVPNLKFVHRLTKLNFQVITAKAQSGQGNQGNDREEAQNLKVKEIKLLHVPAQATLTIGPDMALAFAGDATLPMIEENTDDTDIWTDNDEIIPQEYQDGGSYTSAGYLMVPEVGEDADVTYPQYLISLVVIASDTNGEPQEQTVTLDLSGNVFKAGYSYNLQIALYALQQVEVSATLTDWTPGEDVYIPIQD